MKKILSIFLALTLVFSLTACGGNTDKEKGTETQSQTETEKEMDLTTYVKGLKDWTVEVNSKNVDFMKDVTFDEKVVKEVTADDSKVDLTKEGTYELVYNIMPVDKSISEVAVKKTVTVKVVSVEKAQEESDAGNQVVTSDNVIKKDSNGNTPAPKTDTSEPNTGSSSSSSSSSKNPSTGSGNSGSNSNSGSSKPSTGGGSSSSGNKPSTGGGNSGSSSKPTEPSQPAHQHNWVTDYKTVHHDAEYKDVYHDAVYEDRPIYKWVGWYECKKCGAQFNNVEECGVHCLDCNSTYTFKKEQQPTGEYEKILVKDAWTEKVLVKDAWDEQVPNGQHCTGCNATK